MSIPHTPTETELLAALDVIPTGLLRAFHTEAAERADREGPERDLYVTVRDRLAAALAARPPTHRGETAT